MKKWSNKILPLYKEAVEVFDFCSSIKWDFSLEANKLYYEYESRGINKNLIKENNGCARGKFLLDLHIKLWKEGIKENLFKIEEFLIFSPELNNFIIRGLN